jgi:hypothetical protein
MGLAFDAAWAHIADNFGSDPAAIDAACLTLAEALLSVADDNSRDVEALRKPRYKEWRSTTEHFVAQDARRGPAAT